MENNIAIEKVGHLYMQCKFKDAIALVDKIGPRAHRDTHFKLQLLKSQALFELHQVDQAKALLTQLTTIEPEHSHYFLYGMARLNYIDQKLEKSQRLFSRLKERSESVEEYFNATLGLGYVFDALKSYEQAQSCLEELQELCELVSLERQLSYYLFKAKLISKIYGKYEEAQKIYKDVIAHASKRGWNYWIIKSLYGMAILEKSSGRAEALSTTLMILQCYLDPQEAVFQAFIINGEFKDQNISIETNFKLDHQNKTVLIDQKVIALHDKPLLFSFLDILNSKRSFVTKQEIARFLWPRESYRPRTHDPRIFDIARRIRSIIEAYESQPVKLLSGRLGYKLTCFDQEHNHKELESSTAKQAP